MDIHYARGLGAVIPLAPQLRGGYSFFRRAVLAPPSPLRF